MSDRGQQTGRASLVVGAADTAEAFASGDLPVLATPRLAALAERAALAAAAGLLAPGETTVGVRLELSHERATPLGGRVSVTATLERRRGALLLFALHAEDAQGRVAAGTHRRLVVQREAFLRSLS